MSNEDKMKMEIQDLGWRAGLNCNKKICMYQCISIKILCMKLLAFGKKKVIEP
jgi:hypothetical protein